MTSNLLELTVDIVTAHASTTELTSDQLIKEIQRVYETLEALNKGTIEIPIEEPKKRGRKTQEPALIKEPNEPLMDKPQEEKAISQTPVMSIEEAFKPDQVSCMICGKTGMKTLKRHLATAHDLKPGEYKKMFSIPKDQPLAATDYAAKRRQMALDRGLGAKLAAARASKKAKAQE